MVAGRWFPAHSLIPYGRGPPFISPFLGIVSRLRNLSEFRGAGVGFEEPQARHMFQFVDPIFHISRLPCSAYCTGWGNDVCMVLLTRRQEKNRSPRMGRSFQRSRRLHGRRVLTVTPNHVRGTRAHVKPWMREENSGAGRGVHNFFINYYCSMLWTMGPEGCAS